MDETGGFSQGQRVHVEFDGIVSMIGSHGLYVIPSGARSAAGWIPKTLVTQLDPPDWPPQVGDTWQADGRDFYVRKSVSAGVQVLSFDDHSGYTGTRLDAFKILNPVLVRRRGQ